MDPHIFKAYDIRGIYPNQLNEEDVYKITKGFFTFVVERLGKSKPPKIVLSWDGRLSSPSLSDQARKALVESGAEVIDIGLSSTPTLYFAVSNYNYDAGIQISASHNPKEYNGLKPVIKSGSGVTKISEITGLQEIREIVDKGNYVKIGKTGTVNRKESVLGDQVENALKVAGNPNSSPYKIVADTADGTGALYLDALFKKIPGKLVKLNFEIDGNFPAHQADPSKFETLNQLREKVLSEKADLGIAPDGDSDRVFFVDEKGNPVTASLITSLLATEILKEHSGEKIGFDVRSTLNVLNAVKKGGGVSVINKVGNTFATEIMKKEDIIFFGENSGHYLFRETHFLESPIPVILMILSIMSIEKKPISEILEPLSVSFQSQQINFKINNSEKVIDSLKEKYKNGEANLIDGLSVDFSEWRFNVRSSNTEPLLRLNVEALEKEVMEEKKSEIENIISSLPND